MFEADLIFINGKVLTMNDDLLKTSSVVIQDGRIFKVGKNKDTKM